MSTSEMFYNCWCNLSHSAVWSICILVMMLRHWVLPSAWLRRRRRCIVLLDGCSKVVSFRGACILIMYFLCMAWWILWVYFHITYFIWHCHGHDYVSLVFYIWFLFFANNLSHSRFSTNHHISSQSLKRARLSILSTRLHQSSPPSHLEQASASSSTARTSRRTSSAWS